MSKRFLFNISSLIAGLSFLAGCSVLQEEGVSDNGREIKFTASVGTFQVKATDNALELDDAVGLFAGAPVNARNVRMTWNGSNLIPEKKLFWTPGQEQTTYFVAYYPYNADLDGDYIYGCVNADQSTHELYTASDLMTATSVSHPTSGTVEFNFVHRLSKLVILIDNQMEGVEIADVYVNGVYGKYETGLGDYRVNLRDLQGTIKAGKVITADGQTAWTVIIPPQYTVPVLMVTTTDGRQYTSPANVSVDFYSGYRYTARAILDGDTVLTDFTDEIVEWTDNNDIAFQTIGQAEWSVVGTVNGSNWDKEFPMYHCYQNEETYYGLIYYKAGDEFMLHRSGSHDLMVGLEAGLGLGWYYYTVNGPAITLPNEGIYEIFIHPDTKSVSIQEVNMWNWGITGSLENLNWNGDHNVNGVTVVDNNPVLCFNVKYRAGEEFKVRFGGVWYLEYGLDADWTGAPNVLEDGAWYSMRRGGPNMMLPQDGLYTIMFDLNNQKISAVRTGDYVVSPITIDGDFSDWESLDPSLVSVAYTAGNSRATALRMMKAYVDANALFVYFEYDVNQLTTDFTPLQLYINSDNNTATGCAGYDKFSMWSDAGYEHLVEGYIFNGGYLENYYGFLYNWSGADGEEGWFWDESTRIGGAVTGRGDYQAYEIMLDRSYLTLPDSFTIGLNIESNDWQTIGFLPNGDVTTTNPLGMGKMLPVNVGGPGVVYDGTEAQIPEASLEAVDLGLSVKWANMNLGASRPEGYGDYYAWGDVQPKSSYFISDYQWSGDEKTDPVILFKYTGDNPNYGGTADGLTTLLPEDDAAVQTLGGNWRMPTRDEIIELRDYTTNKWEVVNGVSGYRFTGPNGNSIFMPAAGCMLGDELQEAGAMLYYWSSSVTEGYYDHADAIEFSRGSYYIYMAYRWDGFSVRAVQ
ncbi:MAG: fimbrillin family protein [Bacteroidales bacterium]|nr:fimbrillin family protein [Bacteroidales bacterium]